MTEPSSIPCQLDGDAYYYCYDTPRFAYYGMRKGGLQICSDDIHKKWIFVEWFENEDGELWNKYYMEF